MLTYTIPEKREKPIYEYLYSFIKEDILSSRLKANDKLPSKRSLAKQLNISLITIEKAYEQLIIEGYIYTIEKSGYFVEDLGNVVKSENKNEDIEIEDNDDSALLNLRFPYATWSSLSRKVLSSFNTLSPSSFKGNFELRKAIANHLREFHSLSVSPNSIIVGAGSEYLYTLLIQYFGHDKLYALENPGHKNIAKIYNANNTKYNYIDLDDEGIKINDLIKSKSSIVHISPAHHFPTGITLSLKRRMELLKWAKENSAYIIEDDYDSEFRFTGKPIPPLYQLDNSSRVIYMNTFSKSLSPTFRIAYLVLPKGMEKDFEEKLGFYHNTVSSLDQMVLARFISDGYFERHISRERKYYKELHNTLLSSLEPINKKYNLKLIDSYAGLHFIIEHNLDVDDKKIEDKLSLTNLNIHTISNYMNEYSNTKKLVVSYSNLKLEEINDYIDSFEKFIKELESRR